MDAQTDEVAVGVETELDLGVVVAAVGIGEEGLAAAGRPLDRAAELVGAPGDEDFFGVVEDLGAEAAADIGRDHAHLVFGQAHDEGGHQQADDVGVLRRGVQSVVVAGIVVIVDGTARLDGVGDDALIVEFERRHVGRAVESCFRGVGIAQAPVSGT